MLPPPAEGSAEVAERVAAARAIQVRRYAELGLAGVGSNAAAPAAVIEAVAQPDAGGLALVQEASDRLRLSARGFHRILKLARTIADLDGARIVESLHLAEALSYRVDAAASSGEGYASPAASAMSCFAQGSQDADSQALVFVRCSCFICLGVTARV